jgi:hypothetical protein
MLVIRDIMYCKPGKVRPMVEKFLGMARLLEQAGGFRMRVMTDVSAERYWTVVAETDVENFQAYMEMDRKLGDMPELGELMKDYHQLIDHGRREIYTLES